MPSTCSSRVGHLLRFGRPSRSCVRTLAAQARHSPTVGALAPFFQITREFLYSTFWPLLLMALLGMCKGTGVVVGPGVTHVVH